jgi:hypothetical protein
MMGNNTFSISQLFPQEDDFLVVKKKKPENLKNNATRNSFTAFVWKKNIKFIIMSLEIFKAMMKNI